MTKYVGWVPTVAGRLSYSVIGQTNHPSEAITANVADNKKRRILCLQNRLLLDSALPIFKEILAKKIFKLSGSFYFFLDAECSSSLSDPSSRIEGNIYILKNKVDKEVDSKIKAIKDVITEFNDLVKNNANIDVDAEYKNKKQQFDDIDKHSLFTGSFLLERDGIIEIDFKTDEHLEQQICAQMFFFIKDVAHRHQHHHPKTDTILDIYEKNEFWQDDILRSLYNRVLDFKRSRNEWVCASALGILTYITAFKKICDKRQLELHLSRDDENLAKSIKIAQEELRHLTLQIVGWRNTWIATAIAIVGMMLMFSSLGSLVDPAIKLADVNRVFNFVLENIFAHQWNTMISVMTASLMLSVLIYKEYWLGKLLWNKDVIRIMVSIENKRISGAILLFISLMFGYIALLLLQKN